MRPLIRIYLLLIALGIGVSGCSKFQTGFVIDTGVTLSVSSTSSTVVTAKNYTFTGSGGTSPYTFTVLTNNSGGSIHPTTGVYTAGAVTGVMDTILITDSKGATASKTVTINPVLAISPAAVTTAVAYATTFSATGGVPPYSYSVTSGNGSVNASSGAYTAGTAGTDTVTVTDFEGTLSNSTVTVNAALALSVDKSAVIPNGTSTFAGTGGITPYAYAVTVGSSTIHPTTGVFTAAASPEKVTVRVTDGNSVAVTKTYYVVPAMGAWYKADALSLNNNDLVALWADDSGNGRNATQTISDPKKPIFKTSQINGLPAVNFTGTNWVCTAAFGAAIPQPYTLISILSNVDATDIFIDGSVQGGTGHGRLMNQASTGARIFAGSNVTNAGMIYGSFVNLTAEFDGVNSELFVNNNGSGTADPGAGTLDGLHLGSRFESGGCNSGGGNASGMTGNIAEVLMYPSILGVSDSELVRCYLYNKYGVGDGSGC